MRSKFSFNPSALNFLSSRSEICQRKNVDVQKKSTLDGKYLIRYLLVLCAGKLAGGVLEVKMIIVLIPEEASVFGTDRGLVVFDSEIPHIMLTGTHAHSIRSDSCYCWCDRILMTNAILMNQTEWNHSSPHLRGA